MILGAAVIFAWLLWALCARAIMRNPWGDPFSGFVWHGGRVFVRVMHPAHVRGAEALRGAPAPGPLIVVANHTAGIDPMLIQCACRFPIRWMMAMDMRAPALEWFWQWAEIIEVDRSGKGGLAPIREALRHLQAGGAIGIFPEGGLERPAETLRPFLAGVGMIIEKSGAPVLPVLIRGTPQVDPAWASLRVPSRPKLEFGAVITYEGSGLKAGAIAADLRDRYQRWTGWGDSSSDQPEHLHNRQ
ncbi:MAG: 1-acyl-sn-glycerol-3-phosphate acyltransferase [Phycisphaerales bacterium]|nr:1-acyl-sn-glycerol-3-phosphate acyltransferase [Phycisphaerales bacterium]